MNGTAMRLFAVIAIVAATYGVSRWVQAETEPPEVEMPTWTFHELPRELGTWRGEDTKLDPKIVQATGAEIVVDRAYRDAKGRAVSLHTAMFKDPAEGVYHSPLNCYAANGWRQLTANRQSVEISPDATVMVDLTTWEKENEQIIVIYWYQLGKHVLYSRLDLGKLRWTMGGQTKWPALVKVMVQIPISANDPEGSKTAVLDFVDRVAQWLNQPDHQKYLGRWGGV